VGFATRQVGNRTKPNLVVSVDDQGFVCLKSQSTFKTTEIKFKLNEPFEETTADDRKTRVSYCGLKKKKSQSESVLEVTACPCLCPADRGDSGERETCAETELGWQRDKYREGDRRWEIGSGKGYLFSH